MDMNLFIDLYNRHIPTKYMAKSLKVGYNTLVNRLHLLGWDVQPAYRTRKTREDIPGDLTWMFQT